MDINADFTVRASVHGAQMPWVTSPTPWVERRVSNPKRLRETLPPIQAWCLEHVGEVLPVTPAKDYDMVELWDDRAVQVIPNTGERADGRRG